MYSMKLIFVDDKKVSVTTILDATIPKQFRREFVTAWNAQDDRATVITEASRVSSALAPAWAARSQDNSSMGFISSANPVQPPVDKLQRPGQPVGVD